MYIPRSSPFFFKKNGKREKREIEKNGKTGKRQKREKKAGKRETGNGKFLKIIFT
jgi:hypothetical protein